MISDDNDDISEISRKEALPSLLFNVLSLFADFAGVKIRIAVEFQALVFFASRTRRSPHLDEAKAVSGN